MADKELELRVEGSAVPFCCFPVLDLLTSLLLLTYGFFKEISQSHLFILWALDNMTSVSLSVVPDSLTQVLFQLCPGQ